MGFPRPTRKWDVLYICIYISLFECNNTFISHTCTHTMAICQKWDQCNGVQYVQRNAFIEGVSGFGYRYIVDVGKPLLLLCNYGDLI